MSLQHLHLKSITEAELGRLVSDAIPESKTLEYKEALVYVTEEQKREFLSDITALANTDGGDLVLGMKAEKGVAIELVGLRNLEPDSAKNKIEDLLRNFVQPRIIGCQIHDLLLANGNRVLIIRVPRSFAAPHMIRHQGVTRFCGRNAAGKYDLDVHELRSAFLANETYSERLKSFRLERINRLISGETPVPLIGTHLIVLHILPVVSARPDTRVAKSDFTELLNQGRPRPIGGGGFTPRFNFDGLLTTSDTGKNSAFGYVQVMRNGFLEAVDSFTLEPRPGRFTGSGSADIIPSITWELRLLQVFSNYLEDLTRLRLAPPFATSISLLNVRGFSMYVGMRYEGSGIKGIDRDHLLTEEILIETPGGKPETVLRPLFDQVWNGCGWHQSINYDENGNWREHP